ncbi:MAG: 30S ribosome-binding factor RbfA [Clostridiales bacterium]|nr:30S ribosome-binding factor RbfA [Clostridiales bacterium]
MPSNRIGRINEEIQREMSSLIRTVKDPRVADAGMVSVTAVETTPDLKYAKIYVSVLDKTASAQALKGLKSASGYLRRELGHALNLRNTPELSFVRDDSIDKGAHILDMLRDPEVVKPANPANAHIILDEED